MKGRCMPAKLAWASAIGATARRSRRAVPVSDGLRSNTLRRIAAGRWRDAVMLLFGRDVRVPWQVTARC